MRTRICKDNGSCVGNSIEGKVVKLNFDFSAIKNSYISKFISQL